MAMSNNQVVILHQKNNWSGRITKKNKKEREKITKKEKQKHWKQINAAFSHVFCFISRCRGCLLFFSCLFFVFSCFWFFGLLFCLLWFYLFVFFFSFLLETLYSLYCWGHNSSYQFLTASDNVGPPVLNRLSFAKLIAAALSQAWEKTLHHLSQYIPWVLYDKPAVSPW